MPNLPNLSLEQPNQSECGLSQLQKEVALASDIPKRMQKDILKIAPRTDTDEKLGSRCIETDQRFAIKTVEQVRNTESQLQAISNG
jgi:endo-beta-N-acetylglucosaminidase D